MWLFWTHLTLALWMSVVSVSSARECVAYDQQQCRRNSSHCVPQREICPEPSAGKRAHCYAAWHNETGNVTVVMQGCWVNAENCYDLLRCEANDINEYKPYFCCCDENDCNKFSNLFYVPTVPSGKKRGETAVVTTEVETVSGYMFFLYTLAPLIIISLLSAIAFFAWRRCHYRELSDSDPLSAKHPLMQKDEIKKPIVQVKSAEFTEKLNIVASGRFGCVWRAKVHGREVALKVLPASERSSWQRECEVYALPGVSVNDSILAFVSAEEYVGEKGVELRILTEFHQRGSLYDYLKANEMSWSQLLTVAETMLRGLAFLHDDSGAKPVIAHRDFKSKNVLLKDNLTACIGDFGLALTFETGASVSYTYSQVGTNRYMAPELLDGAMCFSRDAFLRVDIYACALVLWEMVNRCSVLGSCGPYRLPYEDVVGLNPSVQALNNVVIKKGRRPLIRDEWKQHEGLRVIADTLEECWDVDPEARLSACCVLERVVAIVTQSSTAEAIASDNDSACSMTFRVPSTGETSLNTCASGSNSSSATLERTTARRSDAVAMATNAADTAESSDIVAVAPPNVTLRNEDVVLAHNDNSVV